MGCLARFEVQGLEVRVQGEGFGVENLCFRVWASIKIGAKFVGSGGRGFQIGELRGTSLIRNSLPPRILQ